jgi:hypothetical protein
LGEAAIRSTVSRSSLSDAGRDRLSAASAWRSSCQSGRAKGRWYVGPSCAVDHGLAVPFDLETPGLGHLADVHRLDVPLRADLHEALDVVGLDDGHHPLLRLAHQDLLGHQARVTEGDQIERDAHAAVAGAGQLGGRTRQAGATEVLDAGDHPGREQLQRALDQQLLHERVADLDTRPLGRSGGGERLRGQHTHAADAVAAGARAVQDHPVALA